MARRVELDSILSELKIFDFKLSGKPEDVLKLSKDFDALLFTAEGVELLKQHNKNFEVLLPVFTSVIYCDDLHVAKSFFKYFEVVTDIFRSKLPKIKKGEWWKKFELEHLVKSIPKLTGKISPSDDSWVQIWSFTANLIVSDTALSTVPLNTLLSISETSFRKGKEHPEILDQAWKCWVALIDAFGRSPKILLPSKTLNLLLKPLLACYSVSKLRISTWIHLIEVKGITSTDDTIKQLVESFCKAMYKTSGEKAVSRHLPEECAEALIKLISHVKVVEHCMGEIVSCFGPCVGSRPTAGIIAKLACALITAINDNENEVDSYKLWKTLLEQYKSCSESPILSQACQVFFTEVNFQRWVDSGTVESKDIVELMYSSDFRSKVLLRSVTFLPSTGEEESNTPKKKNKKGSPETVWSNYCEAYISWWSNQSPLTPVEIDPNSADSSISLRNGHDYQAMLALIIYPIQLNSWGPAISKTWTMVCETCHKHRLLQHMIKQIFDALQRPPFQFVRAIEVLNILFGIDAGFCKQSTKVLEALIPKVYSMEVKHIMDLLNVCEIAVASHELLSVIGKILKNMNEIASSESDQLNAHKIRTKVGKMSRKIEHLSNSSEKDKPSKTQRTPFRTQSNFLQRLAKAEEKNKTKNAFLSSIFSPNEKTKGDDNGEIDNGISELPSQDTSLESISNKFSDEVTSKKSLKPLDDSENVPIIMPLMSPSNLKDSLSAVNREDGEREVIVAEKENVIVPSPAASPTVSSSANKLKITNARELKVVDISSPTMVKKAKPLAGQKVTPKKATPSKVSYFDDDANDYVMVPPKPKTTPLTEHQMEMMTKRRTDIPAMYQDLSQDTQISNPPSTIVQEMTNGVSPQENEDIVHGTPSPIPISSLTTPERPKVVVKTNSAKKLDFNNLVSTPPMQLNNDHSSNLSPAHDIQSKKEPVVSSVEPQNPESPNTSKVDAPLENGPTKMDCEENKEAVQVTILSNEDVESPITPKKETQVPGGDEKTKRKRKSEPIKFSPKQTRSKKNLRSVTPDAKLSKSLTSEANRRPAVNDGAYEIKKSEEKVGEKSWISLSTVVNGLPEVENTEEKCLSVVPIFTNVDVDKSLDVANPIVSQNSFEIGEDKGKTSRKRKCKDAPSSDSCKKIKPDDETPSKKACLLKKKKPFKLTSGNNNLENWLVKTERVPNLVCTSTSTGKIEENDSEEIMSNEPLASDLPPAKDESVNDLNNSEEIVPSTQEVDTSSLLDNAKTILSCKIKNDCLDTVVISGEKLVDVIVKEEVDVSVEEGVDVNVREEVDVNVREEVDANVKDEVGVNVKEETDSKKPQYPCDNDEQVLEPPAVTQQNSEMPFPEPTEESSKKTQQGSDPSSPEPAGEPPKKNGNSVFERLAQESPNDDDLDLIIYSPTKRHKRASSVLRGEGDTYLTKDKFLTDGSEEGEDELTKRSLRNRGKTPSPSTQSRKSLHPAGGRSARMLRLAASSTQQDEESGMITPTRKRENVVPMTYGENWPKGPTEDWIACAPLTPYTSPFRGVLKRTPLAGDECQLTPKRCPLESLTSPLLSSAKRKRVMFLDPPVTRGLIYERDSPFGAVHLADIPQGSPYPTWKGDDDTSSKQTSLPTTENASIETCTVESHVDLITPNILSEEAVLLDGSSKLDKTPITSTKSITIPSNELEYNKFRDKYRLEDDFIEQFSQYSLLIRGLLTQCFESLDMEETVDGWKLSACRKICELPYTFLSLVKNERSQSLIEILKAVNLIPPSVELPVSATAETQTDPTNVPTSHSGCQTELQTCSVMTNTLAPDFATNSTQADQELPPPSEVPPILNRFGFRKTLEYCSEYLRILSEVQGVEK